VNDELASVVTTFLDRRCDTSFVRAALASGEVDALWAGLEEMGLPLVSVSESAGGSGGTLEDAGQIIRAIGAHAAPVPAAETGVLAGWLLSCAGLQVAPGPMTVGPVIGDETVTVDHAAGGVAVRADVTRIPWARIARRIVLVGTDDAGQEYVMAVDRDACDVRGGANLAGEWRDSVRIELRPESAGAVVREVPRGTRSLLQARGALVRANLVAGALDRIADMTLRYSQERTQFGRPISSFQAVQAHLVRLVGHRLSANLTAAAALRMFESAAAPELLAAVAASSTGLAGRVVAAAAHQVHGAIGVTEEYDLQLFTRRVAAWTQEFGGEAYWNRVLGARLLEHDPARSVWEFLTTDPTSSADLGTVTGHSPATAASLVGADR